ncbi:cation diffusion facilitator family transporter [Nocardia abscessus]|uniref:cation diffusion facilitator family transporter n=1 Tax=Nocardia abscessus TaxID=120957 RepID=UPI002B4B776F|nr:cation transporter [Nocardia abscessus]
MRALLFSLWASVCFVVLSLVWGIAAGSQMIVFDGLYSLVSIGLSALAIMAHRTAAKGADSIYPWGRETWEPVAIVVKSTALGGLCLYGSVNAVREIVHGGRAVSAGSALTYAVIASLGGIAVAVVLLRAARTDTGLVRAEAAEWVGDAALSLVTLGGFLIAVILNATGHDYAARFVDPSLVLVVSLIYLWVPVGLFRAALREILTMAAAEPVGSAVAEVGEELRAAHGFDEFFVRASKVGSRLDVELAFVVGSSTPRRDVDFFDEVRAQIQRRLHTLGYRHSTSVLFTAQRQWVDWSH